MLSVGQGAGRVYLNFARGWKGNFTISVERKDLGVRRRRHPPRSAPKRMRVRDWVMWRNGPMIEAIHPEKIELLADAPKGDGNAKRPKQEPRPAIAL